MALLANPLHLYSRKRFRKPSPFSLLCRMPQMNIRRLAAELGLSIGTVSKALKDSYEISTETKERVLALAKELNYTPNPYASSLRLKKSHTIAVVIPEVADSFFSLALKGIEEIAQSKGYHVLIYLSYESGEKEKKILADFSNGRVDGVLLSVAGEHTSADHLAALHESGIPVVFFDRALEKFPTAKVRTDDYLSGITATRHLIEKGCRRIAFLSFSTGLDINEHRRQGYLAALAEHHLPADESLIVDGTNNAEQNYANILKLMQQSQRPDGVIASVEKLITPFYLACQYLHLRLPSDIKVIGFSNLANAQILQPSLTTITQPAFEMGRAAATILFRALENRNYKWQKEDIVIPSKLFERDSTR